MHVKPVIHCCCRAPSLLSSRRTGQKERIWTSDTQHYFESIVSLLSDQQPGPIPLHGLKLLLSRESKDEPAQYFVKR